MSQTPLSKLDQPSSPNCALTVAASSEGVPATLSRVHPSVNSVLKRGMDVGFGLLGLLVLVILFIPVAIAIKLDSPGPILYRQERCGLQGRRFVLYKFRTMVENADQLKHSVHNEAQGLIFKNRHDPRITRVGRFLRRSSLDEFPQFWSVVRGDMSLVGTRPPLLDEVAQYSEHHWQRLDVKPGLTGEWQISGRSDITDFEQILALDLRYQSRWNPQYDLLILWKTLFVVLRGSGSY